MSKRNFESFIEGFLEYSKNIESPEKFLLWSAISCIAGALERKTWLMYSGGTQYVYPNEYIMLVGESGVKKSTGASTAIDLLHEVQGVKFMSTQVTAASLVKQLSDAGNDKTLVHNGQNYKNSSIYLFSSEASVTLKELHGGGSVVELMTNFYDCEPAGWSSTRYWSKETIGGGKSLVYNPCINMLACSTPNWLVKSIGKSEIQGGFTARILFVVQQGKSERSIGWHDIDQAGLLDMRRKLVEDLRQIASMSGQFSVSKDFGPAYNKMKHEVEAYLAANPHTPLAGYYARKMWHCLKLCQILAADQGNEKLITTMHLDTARKLLESLEPDMASAFGVHGENIKTQSLYSMWKVMSARDIITKKELLRLVHKDVDYKIMAEHISTLQDMGKIKVEVSNGKPQYLIIDKTPLS